MKTSLEIGISVQTYSAYQASMHHVLVIIHRYLLTPTSANSSTAKYARPGELFGKMGLGQNLSEDTTAGRLILTNCNMLLLSKPDGKKDKKKKEKVT